MDEFTDSFRDLARMLVKFARENWDAFEQRCRAVGMIEDEVEPWFDELVVANNLDEEIGDE